jgi:hypothetical protein
MLSTLFICSKIATYIIFCKFVWQYGEKRVPLQAQRKYNTYIMDLKSRIKFAIKRQGFTLEQVAAKMKRPDGSVGLAQSALSQMLANGNPSYNKLEEIAGIIGLSVSELVKDQSDNKIICPYCGKPIIFTKEVSKEENE